MQSKANVYEMDMCHGPLFPKLVMFAVPLMLSGILQLLFNAMDIIVVGRFTGSQALAAVGATSSLIHLLVNAFIGVSVGANVLAAQCFAADNRRDMYETVHTAITAAIVGGLILMVGGILLSEILLAAMGTPADVLSQSVLYMRIYFCGMPFFLIYNFGAAILNAVGDTRRPLLFLSLAGVTNVAVNLLLVIVFHMGVAGVAIATVISQAISAGLILRTLCRAGGSYRLALAELHIRGERMKRMLQIGLPAGIQGMLINFSNVLIQSSVNSFGSLAMAGYTAAGSIDGFLYVSVNAVTQTCLSFTSQNIGVGDYRRADKILAECVGIVVVLGSVLGVSAYLGGNILLQAYTTDPVVVGYGMEKLKVTCIPYCIGGIMDLLPSALRARGHSIAPMLVSLSGVCLFRIFWILFVFPQWRTLFCLYISYPVSWALTMCAHGLCYCRIRKEEKRREIA